MKRVGVRGPTSPLVRKSCALFGVQLVRARKPRRRPTGCARAARAAARVALGGGVVLITGPSGGGKSTLVRTIAVRLGCSGALVLTTTIHPCRRRQPLLEFVAGGPSPARGPAAMPALAAAGLAEPALFPRPLAELSDGQRMRAGLAAAMVRGEARGRRRPCIIADEFASVLDRVTALGVARAAARWARARGLGLVAATAHGDVRRWLRPDLLVRISLDGRAELHPAEA